MEKWLSFDFFRYAENMEMLALMHISRFVHLLAKVALFEVCRAANTALPNLLLYANLIKKAFMCSFICFIHTVAQQIKKIALSFFYSPPIFVV